MFVSQWSVNYLVAVNHCLEIFWNVSFMKAFYLLRIHESVFLSAVRILCCYSVAPFYSNGLN